MSGRTRGGRTRGRAWGGRPASGDAAATARAWAELLRVSAVFTVPGDALAGAAVSGLRLNRGTALAAASSLCLYEAGMTLNDWADRHIDAVERPARPLPSGRVAPSSALAASAVLTAAGLGLAAAAGRRALLTATALAGTVWAYDLRLKHTALGPAAMAAARGLDVVLGAAATAEAWAATSAASAVPALLPEGLPDVARAFSDRRRAPGGALRDASRRVPGMAGTGRGSEPVPVRSGDVLRAAGLVGAHILAVTTVSRRETLGASPAVPLVALGAVGVVASAVGGAFANGGPPRTDQARTAHARTPQVGTGDGRFGHAAAEAPAAAWLRAAPAVAYAAAGGRPLAHAVFNPSPALLQRAVGGGIRATIPLQAALAARAGRPGTAAAVLALLPAALRLSRKVSPT